MPNVVLIRPGCTDFDDQHRVQGALDLPLNHRGQQEQRAAIEELRTIELDALYTGPCEPARGTAIAIADALDLPLHEVELLKNLDQGLWQGLEIEEIRRKFPKVMKQWEESPERICPPQGEPVSEALLRIQKALRKPLKKGMSFAIIASEPLASLIGLMVRGEKAESQPMCGCESDDLVEFLVRDEAAAVANPAVETNDRRTDGRS